MKQFLLNLRKKYPNNQEFGNTMAKILEDDIFIELLDTNSSEMIYLYDKTTITYNKYNMLLEKLTKKYLNE